MLIRRTSLLKGNALKTTRRTNCCTVQSIPGPNTSPKAIPRRGERCPHQVVHEALETERQAQRAQDAQVLIEGDNSEYLPDNHDFQHPACK